MSVTLIIAAAIVIVSSLGFIVVGSVYDWNVTAVGYGRWTRAIGMIAVLSLAGVTAWDRLDEPLLAAGIALLGIALAAGFAVVHRRLQERVRRALS